MFSEEGLRSRLFSGNKLRIKFGADPSRPDLHIGHSVVLRRLRLLQELGHEICFVIGDFTGMIGDPSGRSKTRPALSFDETRQNGKTYFEQVSKIIDTSMATIVYNSDWLSHLHFEEVLKLASRYTVARILERDDFANRMRENQPVGLHELFYPLMQGYDSIALHSDIEVGGTDQTFNLLVGRELQRSMGQEAQEVITFPLLPGLDGTEKMSKSLDNYIGITEPAGIMFEKAMRVPDTLLSDYFRLTTDIPEEVYRGLLTRNAREAHFVYARELVRIYHDEHAVEPAEARYRENADGGIPENIPRLQLPSPPATVAELVRMSGLAPSNAEARRLIEGGGIRIDGKQALNPFEPVQSPGAAVVSRGKARHVSAVWTL